MRLPRILPALCLALTLHAGSPWDDFLQRRQGGDPRAARWSLCVRPADFNTQELMADPTFQKLIVSGDVAMEALGTAEAEDHWARQSWGSRAHWVLLSPMGEVAASDSAPPRGEPLLDAIHARGQGTRWETRAAFLKDHPDQGEARLEEVLLQFGLMRARLMVLDRQGKLRIPLWHPEAVQGSRMAGPGRLRLPETDEGKALAEELQAEAAKALANLFSTPGWAGAVAPVTAQLGLWDVSQSSAMRAVFAQVEGSAEALLRQDPYDFNLASFWMEAREAAGLPPADLGAHFAAVPGRVWPTPAILNRLLEPYRRRQDWEGALKTLGDLTPSAHPEPLTRRGWEEYCRLQCALLVQKGIAMANLGSWDLASGAVEDARLWGGGHGVREALLLRGSQWSGAEADMPAWRNLLNQALAKDGPRPAMPDLEPPLRLMLLGNPKWLPGWTRLAKAADLLPWSPAELRWETASQPVQEKLAHQFGWPPGPRWALFRGEELRATGLTCPEPKALATALEGEGSPMLQRLQRLLDGQPEHSAAHRARFALLLPRMPEPRLEEALARDGAGARLSLDFDLGAAWKPDPDVWAAAAQEVLPRVEEELRSWPNRGALWTVWISWARFHPRQPSIVALAQSLPYWAPQGDWRAGLPYGVQRTVAVELRRQGSFDIMRTWFRAAWDALDKRPLASLRFGEREWVQERRREEETAIFQPLRDALQALRCTQEQAELERAFSAMMGQDMSRRR